QSRRPTEQEPAPEALDRLLRADPRIEFLLPEPLAGEIRARIAAPDDQEVQDAPLHARRLRVDVHEVRGQVDEVSEAQERVRELAEVGPQALVVLLAGPPEEVPEEDEEAQRELLPLVMGENEVREEREPGYDQERVTFLHAVPERESHRGE